MKLVQPLLFSFLNVFAFHSADAQQIYKSNHYGGPGTQYLYNAMYGFNQDSMLTRTGEDLTWDITGYTGINTHLSKIVTKESAFDFFTYLTICGLGGTSSLDCVTIWGNTDQAWLTPDTVQLFQFQLTKPQRYQKRTNSLLLENFLGFTGSLGGATASAVVVYSNPDTILHFPVTFGDQFTSSIQWSIDLSSVGQNIKYVSHQHRSTNMDAWGDLITPLQTFENTVRMHSIVERYDTLTTDTAIVPLHVRQVEYMWFDTLYKLPVMVANGIINDTTVDLASIQYLWDKTCAAPTWTASIASDTYSIDSSGSVTIAFTIDHSNADEYTWEWGDGQVTTTTGSTTHTFTEAGAYSVGLTGCMTNCLPLNSCSYDILDFVILGDQTLPGEDRGIKIYPNPVADQINLFIPEAIGSSQYRIVDMNGRQVQSGNAKSGLNNLRSDSLPEGMYAIQVRPIDPLSKYNYHLRFIVARQ